MGPRWGRHLDCCISAYTSVRTSYHLDCNFQFLTHIAVLLLLILLVKWCNSTSYCNGMLWPLQYLIAKAKHSCLFQNLWNYYKPVSNLDIPYINEHHILSSVSRSCRFGIKFPVQISFESLFVALQVDVKRSMDDGEKSFNQLSIEERHLAYFLRVFCHKK
jgi:hypothetical protein